MSPIERLARDAATLGVQLTAEDATRLMRLLGELARWNRSYNLTAITAPGEMVTHHLLDSLAIQADLAGARIADVGTGAGFPGLPLALVNPTRQFTLIDSSGKKIRFVAHAARTLGLTNVTALHLRAETFRPAVPFDTVIARAFAPLPLLLERAGHLCARGGRVLAMKGRWPERELEHLPAPWTVERSRTLTIPGLDEARCVLVLTAGAAAAPSSP
ncbi:MAG TPA: 16S rRNA (guanine(527)-N(7))-methyltransferase RsmG [Steroidobacteraceae bacterium]|nr:16S rRNA (guanine(527)-N(7))-methyltransferase RsmG [Steroidobacteraceae bacterium]